MRQDLIKKLRAGEIAVLNNGNLELIQKILDEAFPKDKSDVNNYRGCAYYVCTYNGNRWNYLDNRDGWVLKGQTFVEPEQFIADKTKVTDLGENEAILCETKEEAQQLCTLMDEKGLKWLTGDSYLGLPTLYFSDRVYYPTNGTHGSLSIAKENRRNIYPASQFINPVEEKNEAVEQIAKMAKEAKKLNKELRETLKLKKEIAGFDSEAHFQAGTIIELPNPTRNGFDWLHELFEGQNFESEEESCNLKLNKWYKRETEKGCTFAYFQGFDKITYGISHYGDWVGNAQWFSKDYGVFEDNFGKNGKYLEPATYKEVLEAVIKVLKK